MKSTHIVKELFVYPIKSLAGISIQSAKAQEMGFEYDRRWMLIDEENRFITQREHPDLSQFYPKIIDGKIEITNLGKTHSFYIDESFEKPISVNVWDDESRVVEVNKLSSEWFSNQLGFRCKLVKIINNGDRKHKSTKLNTTFNVSLADGYPYLLVGSESLNNLNEKLKDKIGIERFRPNIVISSITAHEEDSFDQFQIGKVKFQNVKPCGRCIMVNNNPETGRVTKEPLRTLNTYRTVNNSILFGVNIVCQNSGIITVGDVLEF